MKPFTCALVILAALAACGQAHNIHKRSLERTLEALASGGGAGAVIAPLIQARLGGQLGGGDHGSADSSADGGGGVGVIDSLIQAKLGGKLDGTGGGGINGGGDHGNVGSSADGGGAGVVIASKHDEKLAGGGGGGAGSSAGCGGGADGGVIGSVIQAKLDGKLGGGASSGDSKDGKIIINILPSSGSAEDNTRSDAGADAIVPTKSHP